MGDGRNRGAPSTRACDALLRRAAHDFELSPIRRSIISGKRGRGEPYGSAPPTPPMNVYTDPKLLDVHGALDSLPATARFRTSIAAHCESTRNIQSACVACINACTNF